MDFYLPHSQLVIWSTLPSIYRLWFKNFVFYPPPLLCLLSGICNPKSSIPHLMLSAPRVCTHSNVLLETKVRLAIGWASGKEEEPGTASCHCSVHACVSSFSRYL